MMSVRRAYNSGIWLWMLMDISGVDLSAIRASTMSAEAGAFPPEREQSFGGGGRFA